MKKIKLNYPKYKFNRLKNPVRNNFDADSIYTLMATQNELNNGLSGHIREDLKNPGPWTLHFDGKDFWFEGSNELISWCDFQ
jgi:hypothetical protein